MNRGSAAPGFVLMVAQGEAGPWRVKAKSMQKRTNAESSKRKMVKTRSKDRTALYRDTSSRL